MGQIFGVSSNSSSDTRKSLSSDEDFIEYENDGFEPVMSTKSKDKNKKIKDRKFVQLPQEEYQRQRWSSIYPPVLCNHL